MKTNYLKYTPALLVALFASSNASALGYGGSAPGDHLQYVEGPAGVLTADPGDSASLAYIIAGNAGAPGGNTELFHTSDSMSNTLYLGSPTAYVPGSEYTKTTTLEVGFLSGDSLSLSSLTAKDWGAKGDPTSLLEIWSTAILTKFDPGFSGTDLSNFETLFVASKGEQRLSDPNISYVYTDTVTGDTHIGLAGFLDASVATGLLPLAVQALGVIPPGAQISEIVKVTDNLGQSTYLYAIGMDPFNPLYPNADQVATPSGVYACPDGTSTVCPPPAIHSYDGNFDFTIASFTDNNLPGFNPGNGVNIPEPSGLALLVAGLTGFLGLRRKAVKS